MCGDQPHQPQCKCDSIKNKDLKSHYNQQKLKFYPGFEESRMITQLLESWEGKRVLEIGCGQGHLGAMLSYAGARYTGIDYAAAEIKRAREQYPNLRLYARDYKGFSDATFDVVVMQGVLEHLDSPFLELQAIASRFLESKIGSQIILSVPNWINPRGLVYNALRLLFGVQMSLTDLHYFLPDEFLNFAGQNHYKADFVSCDFSRGNGQDCINDLKKRIPKAFGGSTVPEGLNKKRLSECLEFLGRQMKGMSPERCEGATLGIALTKIPQNLTGTAIIHNKCMGGGCTN